MNEQTESARPARPRGQWFKSTRSGGDSDCVEACFLESGDVAVRDSKNPDGPRLIFTASEWGAFIGGAKDGEFDQ
ncbi:DUF397 domain-containing protein [Actinoplanes sp. NPDC000266]